MADEGGREEEEGKREGLNQSSSYFRGELGTFVSNDLVVGRVHFSSVAFEAFVNVVPVCFLLE